MELLEKTLERNIMFQGAIMTVRKDKVLLGNGKTADREVADHVQCVVILPLHEDATVTLVRQFRYPFMEVVTELPAGKMDPGETHRQAALRELEEEVGAIPGKLTYLGCLYTSPGFTNEVLHMYLAQDLGQGTCHPDEDEFLEIERIPFDSLLEQVMNGAIKDGKTVAMALKVHAYLARQASGFPMGEKA